MSNAKYQVRKRNPEAKPHILRKNKIVPGIVYGEGYEDSLMIEMDLNEFNRLTKENSYSSMIPLKGLDKETTVIIKEIQMNHLLAFPIHFDFQAISKGQIITLAVPVRVIGEENLKGKEIFIQTDLAEISVKGKIEDIPEVLELDVSNFELGDRITVANLELPKDMEVEDNPESVVIIAQSSARASEDDDADEADAASSEAPAAEPVAEE